MRLGWSELLIVLAILLVLFGARRLPDIARSFGQAIREFQRSLRSRDHDRDQPPPPSP
jgi:sec-independent protein translocase protein TatA